MATTVAEFIIQRLKHWGVRRVFGYPGDGINGLMGAIDREGNELDYIRVRHEEMSAFMACGHAKFTGEIGVCIATSGPGALHLLTGLYDAKMDHVPVLALVGQQGLASLGSDFQQEVNLASVFEDVACYVQTIVDPKQARHVIDRALRIALAERGVAVVIVPNDVQKLAAETSPAPAHGLNYSSVGEALPRPVASADALQQAAAILDAGEKIAVLAGAGALHATDALIRFCEHTGAGLATALLGKAAVPGDLPWLTGTIGLLGTKPSWELMQGCDTLVLVGTTFPYAEFLPKEGQARAIQIDIAPRNVGLRHPTEVNLIGDSTATLEALIALVERKTDRAWQQKIAGQVGAWHEQEAAHAMQPANPINPQRVFHELSPRLPDQVILCGDSGSSTHWYARFLKLRRGMMGSLSGKLASMGSAVPYAIAAKLAYPERPVIAIAGDGAMQMNGNAELITVMQYWRRWADPRFIVLVLSNHDLNHVTWEQRVLSGDPKFVEAQEVIEFGYARYAELLGFVGIKVTAPDEIGPAWEQALAADRPVLIEFVTDPNTPPLPPHITLKDAKGFASSLIKGDPDRGAVIEQSVKQLLAG